MLSGGGTRCRYTVSFSRFAAAAAAATAAASSAMRAVRAGSTFWLPAAALALPSCRLASCAGARGGCDRDPAHGTTSPAGKVCCGIRDLGLPPSSKGAPLDLAHHASRPQ